MSDKFVILHLSDSHIGHPKKYFDSLNVLEPLLDDIEGVQEQYSLTPNLIVFTGDIAYGHLESKPLSSQYNDAVEFIDKIYFKLNKTREEIPIIIVPGNHDINRTVITEPHEDARDKFNTEKVNSFMNEKGLTWTDITRRQKEWSKFYNGIKSNFSHFNETFLSSTMKLKIGQKEIGIAGLNSSWASHGNNEQGKLWIGQPQFDEVYHAIKETDFRIIALHHPIDWMTQEEKNSLTQKIETKFHLYLHGHEHSSWYTDSNNHLKIGAGACYEGSEKENGYSWIEIDFDNNKGKIFFRKYNDAGATGWIANIIPDKTNSEGVAEVENFLKDFKGNVIRTTSGSNEKDNRISINVQNKEKPHNLKMYIEYLENAFKFRWEPHNCNTTNNGILIYWPVKLRHPTPIHASQCFAAAGLQKYGCKVNLWIDDLGRTEYNLGLFEEKIKAWLLHAGGTPEDLVIKYFKDEKESSNSHKMITNWLTTEHYRTEDILRISKIISQNSEKDEIITGIKQYRPRRILTPSMVWSCLLKMIDENSAKPIITLGGYDEEALWQAWRTCNDISSTQIGNLFVSNLIDPSDKTGKTMRMKNNTLGWTSKHDIENEFQKDVEQRPDSNQFWNDHEQMIPWCINNCVLLPSFIKNGSPSMTIGGDKFRDISEMKKVDPGMNLGDIANEVSKWLLN